MKVLVTGISGKLGRMVGQLLAEHGHEVLGVDRRPWAGAPEGVKMFQVDIRKRPAEDVFRVEKPDAVIHMATVTHITDKSPERFRINLQGTRTMIEHCHTYGVKQIIFISRHTYYGAAPDSPLYHTEDEPPIALNSFPELADLVASDLYAGSALWRYPEIDTCVLRLCYTLGPSKHGTLAQFLQGPRVPTMIGFDPLFHFMHEMDAAHAICAAFEKKLRGVFNVSGPPPVPLSIVIRETGRQSVPVPQALINLTLGRFGLPTLPKGAVDHIKYPIVIDSAAFQKASGFKYTFDERKTMKAFADAG